MTVALTVAPVVNDHGRPITRQNGSDRIVDPMSPSLTVSGSEIKSRHIAINRQSSTVRILLKEAERIIDGAGEVFRRRSTMITVTKRASEAASEAARYDLTV